MYPDDLHYTEDHEWIRVEGDTGVVGITHFAQEQLGDIVFVELPEVGDTPSSGDTSGSIESVKAVSDIFCPIGGEIVEVNVALDAAPETLNSDPYGEGWIFKIKMSNPGELDDLMNVAAYQEFLKEAD